MKGLSIGAFWAWALSFAASVAAAPVDCSVRVDLPGAGGSGVAIHPEIVVTNSHVVDHRHREDVTIVDVHGRRCAAVTIAIDKEADVCLLYCRGRRFPFARLAVRDPDPGRVVVFLGWGPDRRLKQGRGPIIETNARGRVRVLTTAVHSEPGDSGGGLFDLQTEELVALNWGGERESGYSASTPVSYVRHLAEQWVTESLPQERWQEFQCFGGRCASGASPTAGSARGVAPPKWPVSPPAEYSPPPPPPTPPQTTPVTPPAAVTPPPPVVNTDQLAAALVEKLASDERFRGPPGPAGPPGKDGEPGRDAREIDEEALVAKVLARLDLDEIAARVPRPATPTPAQPEVHYVLVGNEGVADWASTQAALKYTQSRFHGLTVAAPPANYVGPLPVLVRYTDSIPEYVARGGYDVRQALTTLAQGGRP